MTTIKRSAYPLSTTTTTSLSTIGDGSSLGRSLVDSDPSLSFCKLTSVFSLFTGAISWMRFNDERNRATDLCDKNIAAVRQTRAANSFLNAINSVVARILEWKAQLGSKNSPTLEKVLKCTSRIGSVFGLTGFSLWLGLTAHKFYEQCTVSNLLHQDQKSIETLFSQMEGGGKQEALFIRCLGKEAFDQISKNLSIENIHTARKNLLQAQLQNGLALFAAFLGTAAAVSFVTLAFMASGPLGLAALALHCISMTVIFGLDIQALREAWNKGEEAGTFEKIVVYANLLLGMACLALSPIFWGAALTPVTLVACAIGILWVSIALGNILVLHRRLLE